MKSGNLVEDAEGPLMICCQYEPLVCSDDHDLRHIHQISEQETPLDLSSVIRLEMKGEVVTLEEKDQDSGYNPSPPLVDLADTPDEDLRQLVSVLVCHICHIVTTSDKLLLTIRLLR